MYQRMINLLTLQLERAKMRWKPKSLEIMVSSHIPLANPPDIAISSFAHSMDPDNAVTLPFKPVEYLSVLGVRLDPFGTTVTSVEARLATASICINADTSTWRSTGSFAAKIRAFERYVHPRALHGSRTWHLTDRILDSLRVWENKTLTSILKFKRLVKPGGELEHVWRFRTRTGKVIADLYAKMDIKPIWLKALRSVFREAWRERRVGCILSNPLIELREWQSRVWWAGLENVPAYKRVAGVSLHRRKGPVRLWEDTIVDVCGIHWRSKRAACTLKRDWDLLSNSAITQLTFKYKLPHPPAIAAAKKLAQPKVPDPDTPTLAVTRHDLAAQAGLTLVVDCRPLARVLNGIEKLKIVDLAPLCSRTTDKLVRLQHFWGQFHTKPHWVVLETASSQSTCRSSRQSMHGQQSGFRRMVGTSA